jgi:hypothetical protein
MLKKNIVLILFLAFFGTINAQQFLTPSSSFSHKKTSYVTLKSGKEIKGTIKDLDRKKGLIEEVKIEDGKGKKHKLDAEDIKFMYLPPSGWDKLGIALDAIYDAQKWNDEKIDQDLVNQGYVYFENSMVKIKKKEHELLMQILNPTFSKYVKVYDDPYAKETMSVGIGTIKVAGGNEKSYFVKIGNDAAFKLEKKNYDTEFLPLFGSCPDMKKKYDKFFWSDLAEHVMEFTVCNE